MLLLWCSQKAFMAISCVVEYPEDYCHERFYGITPASRRFRWDIKGEAPWLVRDPRLLREDPVMSAITTFIEGEPTVCGDVFGERAQELDCVVSQYFPMFYKSAFPDFWGMHQTRQI